MERSIQDRLSRLEKQNRHLRAAVAGIALALITLGAFGAVGRPNYCASAAPNESAIADSVNAREFRLIGEDGKVAALLATVDGVASLSIYRGEDTPRIVVGGVGQSAPGFYLFSNKGKVGACLYQSEKATTLSLTGPEKSEALALFRVGVEEPLLMLRDAQGGMATLSARGVHAVPVPTAKR